MNREKLVVLDTECYPNYWLISFKGLESGKLINIEIYGENTSLDSKQKKRIRSILASRTTFGYNSIKYDIPMIMYALSGATCKELYLQSKEMITNSTPDWMTYRTLDLDPPRYDHFDVMEPSPAVMISLKNYGTRVGSIKLWDLPFDPYVAVTRDEADTLMAYCENDLDVTIDLYNAIEKRIELRESMGEQYGLDLRSKSDAQIAETVIASELSKVGIKAVKPVLKSTYKAKYKAPEFIKFESDDLNDLLHVIEDISFTLAANGSVKMPKELTSRKIIIGDTTYKIGIGGLHSQEKSLCKVSNDTHVMRNADFSSYYPFIILILKLYPKHLTDKFLKVYRTIVETRLIAKAEKNKLIAESLKIVINGSFGKLGSKFSKLYSPDLMLAVTITGQLTLLMLIEQMEANGISVVSANTDGLEYFCPRDKVDLAEAIVFDLELATGFEMEHGEYKGLYARDVNNYVAVYDGYTKAKGVYAESWIDKKDDPNVALKKGLQTPIVFIAVRKYLLDGTPLDLTFDEYDDVNFFLSARTVKGGGVYDGEYLGKMVRWYYSTESKGYISYKSNGNKVPKTDGCKPMMDLTNKLPDDLDYEWYFNEAVSALKDVGVTYEVATIEKGTKEYRMEHLPEMQEWSLDKKIEHAKKRIKEFYEFKKGEVYVAFSGGKDSSVLLHLVRSLYPDIVAVFSNTTNEYLEILNFVKQTENVITVNPKKSFNQTVEEYGFPLVSKTVARSIYDFKHPTPKNAATRNLKLTGYTIDGHYASSYKLAKKWFPLIDQDFEITNKCCDVLKKEPIERFEKETNLSGFVGTQASEGGQRKLSWFDSGCNTYEEGSKVASRPLSIWNEDDVWEYLHRFNVPYSEIYDDVIGEDGEVKVKGEVRTGCAYCAFGAHLEKTTGDNTNRFQRLKLRKPKQFEKMMNLKNNGVTFSEALDFIKVKH